MTTSHWTPSYDYSPVAMSPGELFTKSIIYLLLSHIPIIRISESGCEFFCFLNSRDVMIDKTKFVSKKKFVSRTHSASVSVSSEVSRVKECLNNFDLNVYLLSK